MKFKTVLEKEPIDMQWYLVMCPSFSESGFAIAQWQKHDQIWVGDGFGHTIHPYVVEYCVKPLDQF